MVCAWYVHGMCRLGAQLLKLREELGVERQGSTQLQAKMQEMNGDADGYHQTISVLQAASHIPCRYHADTIRIHRTIEPRMRTPHTYLALQVALRSARGGQDGACADGGGGVSAAAAGTGGAGRAGGQWAQAAERDAAGGAGLDSETAAVVAMEGEDKGGQDQGWAGLNVNSIGVAACFIRAACGLRLPRLLWRAQLVTCLIVGPNPGMHERLRGVKDGARSVTEGVKGGMKADALLLVDGLGSVMRGVKSRGFPFGKQVATSLPPAGDSADSTNAEAQSAPPEMQEPPAAPMLDEAPPASHVAPAPAPELLPRVDSLERLLAEAPR